MKRWRAPNAKKGELLAKYGKEYGELDIYYCWNGDEQMGRDSKMLAHAFESIDIFDGNNLREELEKRGYDITTLKFSIHKKQINP